jgi:hypothetical protein
MSLILFKKAAAGDSVESPMDVSKHTTILAVNENHEPIVDTGTLGAAFGEATDAPVGPTYSGAGASLIAIMKGIGNWLSGSSSIAPVSATGTYIIQTDNPGTTFATLPSNAAKELRINNDTGTNIEIQLTSGGADPEVLPDAASAVFACLANTNEWSVRREDQSNTQVTLNGSFIER